MRRIIAAVLLIAPLLFGQAFYQSEGLTLFNAGRYEEALQDMNEWAVRHESERGIARYYIGECYYNLGLDAIFPDQARRYFSEAMRYFETASSHGDLSWQYPGKDQAAVYKRGWAAYRLSELGVPALSNAIQSFSQVSVTATDTLPLYAAFMAAESRLRHVLSSSWDLQTETNPGTVANLVAMLKGELDQAAKELEKALSQPRIPPDFSLAVQLRTKDVAYLQGYLSLLQSTSGGASPGQADFRKSAIQFFRQADYVPVFSPLNRVNRQRFGPDLYYLEASRHLKLYLITDDVSYRQRLNAYLDSLDGRNYTAEVNWMKGCRDFAGGLAAPVFVRLGRKTQSPFAVAARDLPESWYWLAWAQFFTDPVESIVSFDAFLDATQAETQDARIVFLREDAEYTKYLIQFDQDGDNSAVLRRLRSDIEQFDPRSQDIRDKTDILKKLIQIRQTPDEIWRIVGRTSGTEEKLDDSILLIRSALSRARRVTGKRRIPYLDILDGLFRVTRDRRSLETRFYRGMALYLKAEIQETDVEKRRYYFAAADTLDRLTGLYRDEAQYIRARSFFEAAKNEFHADRRQQVFDRARPLFIDMINRMNSLRSLFYLAEIFRTEGNDLAAISCYDLVIQKTADHPEGGFWHANALAGRSVCRNRGDLSVLSQARISEVQFPERLLVINGEVISLEHFADPEYARRQYWESVIQRMVRLGPPPKSPYPADETVVQSDFAKHALRHIRGGVRERVSTIYSGLHLQIILPEGIPGDATVTLDGLPIEPDAQGIYRKRPIVLNSSLTLRIENASCYPIVRPIHFLEPGNQVVYAALLQRMTFETSDERAETGVTPIRFPDRLDGQVVLQPAARPVPINSVLFQEFNSGVLYRDFCYSPYHHVFLATHAKQDALSIFNADAQLSRGGLFPFFFGADIVPISSPEGVAVDSQGRIYVSDWSSHRVIVFNRDGTALGTFGTFGENGPQDFGNPVRFVFPTGVTVSEDNRGLTSDGTQYLRDPVLFIADRKGVHMVSPDGIYYGSLLGDRWAEGQLYSLHSEGYGPGTRVFGYDRQRQALRIWQTKGLSGQNR
ncbi:MAG TPA: hypothetical protein ENN17_02515 [bacterium]|nr:hypothetical protein [bacterium]